MKNIPVNTELGIILGRDGIFIDDIKQEYNKLILIGDINGTLCKTTDTTKKNKWYSYRLEFHDVKIYECQHIDICNWHVESSFDYIEDSNILKTNKLLNKKHYHYIVSTYDYIYSIVATEFDLKITTVRDK